MVSTKMLSIFILVALGYKWTSATEVTQNNCGTCEEQLTKYRRFILQAIINFEDVCDSYRPDNNIHDLLHNYQPQEREDIWAFFKLLMAQFSDVEFVNIIHDSVLNRCRAKLLSGEKRNSVVLGKKQRFHSWGGKRASQLAIDLDSRNGEEKRNEKQYFI